jgi:hypothetical protein
LTIYLFFFSRREATPFSCHDYTPKHRIGKAGVGDEAQGQQAHPTEPSLILVSDWAVVVQSASITSSSSVAVVAPGWSQNQHQEEKQR